MTGGLEISTGEAVLFWILAPLMVLAALGLLFARKAVHAAISVVFVMISLAFLYTALEAPFLGVAQVVVYTGAVMTLFVFVLMLVGVDAADSVVETLRGQRWIAVLFGLGLACALIGVIATATLPQAQGLESVNTDGNPVGVARLIFGQFVFAFELVGALLITAALGAITLTHRERLAAKRDQKATLELRMKAYGAGEGSQVLTPLPAPGVYATHNAADVPALDAQGRPIDASVPRVIRIRGQELTPEQVSGHVADIAAGPYVATIDLPDQASTPEREQEQGEEPR